MGVEQWLRNLGLTQYAQAFAENDIDFDVLAGLTDADLPHPALRQELTLSRATLSAVSDHLSELIGFPISRSFPTYCVCLELRSLTIAGVVNGG